ncbi:hypothetical protein [Maricaulis sp. CAU 1757]
MTVLLHIGYPKTGTTSIQLALNAKRAQLEATGVLYPVVQNDFKQRSLGTFFGNMRHTAGKDLTVARSALHEQISGHSGHVVLSCEEITDAFLLDTSNRPFDGIGQLRDFLAPVGDDVRILLWVRNAAAHYASLMQEYAKRYWPLIAPSAYDLRVRPMVEAFEDAFGTPAIIRSFDTVLAEERDPAGEFAKVMADSLGLQTPPELPSNRSNESLSAEALMALEIIHRTESRIPAEWRFRADETERLWRVVQLVSQKMGLTDRIALRPEAAETVTSVNAGHFDWLHSRGWDGPSPPSSSTEVPPQTSEARLSVSDLFEVDENAALELVALAFRVLNRQPGILQGR